jgi:hypothetical protein
VFFYETAATELPNICSLHRFCGADYEIFHPSIASCRIKDKRRLKVAWIGTTDFGEVKLQLIIFLEAPSSLNSNKVLPSGLEKASSSAYR